MENLRTKIMDALKRALKSGEKERLSVLRLVQAAIKNEDIKARSRVGDSQGGPLQEDVPEDVHARNVGDAEIMDVLARMVKQRRESVALYEKAGRQDLAKKENSEIDVIREFMPALLQEGELRRIMEDLVGLVGAKGLQDKGRLMLEVKSRYPGQVDMQRALGIAQEILASLSSSS